MTFGRKAIYEPIREVAFGGIGATYAAIGTPLTDNARTISITNTTDEEVYISFDGTTNHLRLPVNFSIVRDITTNKVTISGYFIAKRTTIFQKRVSDAPTSGNLWIDILIAEGGD